ncbi:hypothetical protein J6E39_01275 [bacterium]|nr:hypothetical protein [bacterium]
MSLENTINILANFNAIAGAGMNYKNSVDNGASKSDALFGAMTLGSANLFRNAWAADQVERGNYWAGAINAANDYTTAEGAKNALFGLTMSDLPPLFGGWGYGYGYHPGMSIWGGGGCCCNNFMPFSMPMNFSVSMFSQNRFYC